MDIEERLNQIGKHERMAAGNFMFNHTVGIFFMTRDIPNGSGVLLKYKGKEFVITASHLFDDSNPKDAFLVTSDEPTPESPAIIRAVRHPNSKVDLAYIEINTSELKSFKRNFLNPEQLECDYNPKKDDWLCVTGFPGEIKDLKVDHLRRVFWVEGGSLTIWGDPISPKNWGFEKWERDKHLVISYPKEGDLYETGERKPNPYPGGLSGGGIWKTPINPENGQTFWLTNDCKLVAIQHQFEKRSRQICGSKLKFLMEMLEKDY